MAQRQPGKLHITVHMHDFDPPIDRNVGTNTPALETKHYRGAAGTMPSTFFNAIRPEGH